MFPPKKSWMGLSPLEWLFLFACAAYYAAWVFQPFNFSPDERMRFSVTRFLFEHGRLPVNEETIGQPWGYSYAHRPAMFCNVAGALFMKAASPFTSDSTALLLAARMLGVLCVTGTVYCMLRASRLLFRAPFHWLAVCLVAMLPQFAYVGSYVNNDSAALFGSSLVLFAWVSAMRGGWNGRRAAALSAGISICALAYYNSYGWILFSLVMFPLTHWARNGRRGMIRTGLLVAGGAVCLSGCFFLRHLYLYGDLLGLSTSRRFALQYAAPDFVPGVKKPLCESGCSLWRMLFGMQWLAMTERSFIGCFGHMDHYLPHWCYHAFEAVFGAGAVGVLWKGAGWIRGWRRVGVCRWALLFSLAGCLAVPVGLSVLYSYATDFQPQGRYCLPALPSAALLAAKGIERIADGTAPRKLHGAVVSGLCLSLVLVSLASYRFFRSLV